MALAGALLALVVQLQLERQGAGAVFLLRQLLLQAAAGLSRAGTGNVAGREVRTGNAIAVRIPVNTSRLN